LKVCEPSGHGISRLFHSAMPIESVLGVYVRPSSFRDVEGTFGHGSRVPAPLKRNVLLTHCLDYDEEGSTVFAVKAGARESASTKVRN
jgi:hypothetical protein